VKLRRFELPGGGGCPGNEVRHAQAVAQKHGVIERAEEAVREPGEVKRAPEAIAGTGEVVSDRSE
jgi:hypothetical protein